MDLIKLVSLSWMRDDGSTLEEPMRIVSLTVHSGSDPVMKRSWGFVHRLDSASPPALGCSRSGSSPRDTRRQSESPMTRELKTGESGADWAVGMLKISRAFPDVISRTVANLGLGGVMILATYVSREEANTTQS